MSSAARRGCFQSANRIGLVLSETGAEHSVAEPYRLVVSSGIASWQQPDAFLLTCFLNRDALIAALDAEISAESDDANAMTHEQRQQATATIMADMLATDRELSELIWKAQAEGLPHDFRPDANPLAVLSLQLVAVTRANPPGTSPGMAFEVVQTWRR